MPGGSPFDRMWQKHPSNMFDFEQTCSSLYRNVSSLSNNLTLGQLKSKQYISDFNQQNTMNGYTFKVGICVTYINLNKDLTYLPEM